MARNITQVRYLEAPPRLYVTRNEPDLAAHQVTRKYHCSDVALRRIAAVLNSALHNRAGRVVLHPSGWEWLSTYATGGLTPRPDHPTSDRPRHEQQHRLTRRLLVDMTNRAQDLLSNTTDMLRHVEYLDNTDAADLNLFMRLLKLKRTYDRMQRTLETVIFR